MKLLERSIKCPFTTLLGHYYWDILLGVFGRRFPIIKVLMDTKACQCHACKHTSFKILTEISKFYPNGKEVKVELNSSECNNCHAVVTYGKQHDENILKLRARKSEYEGAFYLYRLR